MKLLLMVFGIYYPTKVLIYLRLLIKLHAADLTDSKESESDEEESDEDFDIFSDFLSTNFVHLHSP